MYTITVKISDRGTILLDENGTSATGHMWYSISNGGTPQSFGFAPAVHGEKMGTGYFCSFPSYSLGMHTVIIS